MRNSRVIETIKSRRSVRSYLDVPIPDHDLKTILEAGLYAPSGKNRQLWRFLILKDTETIKAIAKLTVYSRFTRNAPILMLVLTKQDASYPFEKYLIGIGVCLQNI